MYAFRPRPAAGCGVACPLVKVRLGIRQTAPAEFPHEAAIEERIVTNEVDTNLRRWQDLYDSEQTDLRIGFGHYQDTLPPTCSLETKVKRFRRWLR